MLDNLQCQLIIPQCLKELIYCKSFKLEIAVMIMSTSMSSLSLSYGRFIQYLLLRRSPVLLASCDSWSQLAKTQIIIGSWASLSSSVKHIVSGIMIDTVSCMHLVYLNVLFSFYCNIMEQFINEWLRGSTPPYNYKYFWCIRDSNIYHKYLLYTKRGSVC